MITTSNTYGIKAAIDYDAKGSLVCEAAIPFKFLPGDNNPDLWHMNIILGTADNDFCKGDNIRLSNILNEKHINHWLDIRPNGTHDWPLWREIFPHYLSNIK
jgi:esterase/lipase superfamily enzyme